MHELKEKFREIFETNQNALTGLLKISEFLNEQEGEFDPDTRWALTWFEQYQFEPGQYGDAETLSKAKNTIKA